MKRVVTAKHTGYSRSSDGHGGRGRVVADGGARRAPGRPEGLDPLVRLQELLDAAGDGTWRLVEILLEKLLGRPLSLYERGHVEEAWARNVVVVAEEGASEGKLQLPTGDVIDEDDTPGGRLPLHEGDNSLRAEYGLFYKLPVEICDPLRITEEEDRGPARLCSLPSEGAALSTTSPSSAVHWRAC